MTDWRAVVALVVALAAALAPVALLLLAGAAVYGWAATALMVVLYVAGNVLIWRHVRRPMVFIEWQADEELTRRLNDDGKDTPDDA